jgi:hypothetical protein
MHGFGRTLELKTEIARRLITSCGFNAFFIESGAYDFLAIRQRRLAVLALVVLPQDHAPSAAASSPLNTSNSRLLQLRAVGNRENEVAHVQLERQGRAKR